MMSIKILKYFNADRKFYLYNKVVSALEHSNIGLRKIKLKIHFKILLNPSLYQKSLKIFV